MRSSSTSTTSPPTPSAAPPTWRPATSSSSRAVRSRLDVPLAVKLSPYYSAMANFARSVVDAGADGLVLFNRFYQPDLDLDTLDVVARVDLSRAGRAAAPAAVDRHPAAAAGPRCLAGGVHGDPQRPRRGQGAPGRRRRGHDDLGAAAPRARSTSRSSRPSSARWLADHDYESVRQLRGSANHATAGDPAAFERTNYMKTLHSWTPPR